MPNHFYYCSLLADNILIRFGSEREQSDLAGALHGIRNSTLVLRAGTGLAAGADLTVFGNETAKKIGVLVVNLQGLIGAETANLRTGNESSRAAAAFLLFIHHFFTHV
jgi:hypothetical protein